MKENMPLVSVVMPCYNHEKYVAQAIESVLNQTYPNIEFIIADNGSTDRSYEVMKRYEGRVRKLLHLEKNDREKCWEMLIAEAGGSYFAVMTSDDYWEPEKVELQMQAFREQPGLKLCATWAVYTDEDLVPRPGQNVFIQQNRSRGEWIRYLLENGNCIAYPSVIMDIESRKRSIQQFTRGYRQLGDLYLWLCFLLETDIYVVPQVLMKFRWHLSGGNQNESAPSRENNIRTKNEQADILSYMFENMPDELFLQAFGDELVHPDACSHEEIICEKFFALLRLAEKKYYYQPCVQRFFHDNFKKDNGKGLEKTLEQKYRYSRLDFYEYSGRTGLEKYYRDLAKAAVYEEAHRKYLRRLQAFCLAEKEGEAYRKTVSAMNRWRLLSLPESRQEPLFLVYQYCRKILGLQECLDTLDYGTVMEAISGLSTSVESVWEDLQYLEFGIAKADWALFKELVHYGQKEQIDLRESIFPFVGLLCESLEACYGELPE